MKRLFFASAYIWTVVTVIYASDWKVCCLAGFIVICQVNLILAESEIERLRRENADLEALFHFSNS